MTLRTFRTSKGTEIPLLNLRGKEYLEVKYRIVWFREEHPDWSIETELLSVTETSAYARATIRDDQGRVIATSHKFETRQGFPDFIEKAETGAIGRALALIGYGTQFCADEFDEGQRIVDAPVEPRVYREVPSAGREVPSAATTMNDEQERELAALEASAENEQAGTKAKPEVPPAGDPGEYRISFGRKYKGKKLKEIPRKEIEGYVDWLESSAAKKGVPLSQEVRFLRMAVNRFLAEPTKAAKSQQTQH